MRICPGIVMPCGEDCPSVGYGYVAIQDPQRFYDPPSAFIAGTIFPDLVIPKGKYGPNENLFARA